MDSDNHNYGWDGFLLFILALFVIWCGALTLSIHAMQDNANHQSKQINDLAISRLCLSRYADAYYVDGFTMQMYHQCIADAKEVGP